MTDCSGLSEEIDVRKDKQPGADDCKHPKQLFFLFHHPQINQKKAKPIKGMKDKKKEEDEIEGSICMER
jgi:hypothetical protein